MLKTLSPFYILDAEPTLCIRKIIIILLVVSLMTAIVRGRFKLIYGLNQREVLSKITHYLFGFVEIYLRINVAFRGTRRMDTNLSSNVLDLPRCQGKQESFKFYRIFVVTLLDPAGYSLRNNVDVFIPYKH